MNKIDSHRDNQSHVEFSQQDDSITEKAEDLTFCQKNSVGKITSMVIGCLLSFIAMSVVAGVPLAIGCGLGFTGVVSLKVGVLYIGLIGTVAVFSCIIAPIMGSVSDQQ